MQELASRILTILAILTQGIILNYYIILYNGVAWSALAIVDLIAIVFLICTYFYGTRYVKKCEEFERDENLCPAARKNDARKIVGILPLIYASWFSYSSLLVVKICVIFKTFGSGLSGDVFWGTNLLEFVIAGTAGIFAFMVAGRCRKPTPSQKICLDFMQHHVLIEIIDCVEFLTILFTAEHHLIIPKFVTDLILAFACINLVLPTIGLYQLSATNFNRPKPRENFHIIQTIMSTIFGNIPYLIIRVFLWTDHEFTNALFVMKNIIAIGQNLKELFHHFHEDKKHSEYKHGKSLKKSSKFQSHFDTITEDDPQLLHHRV